MGYLDSLINWQVFKTCHVWPGEYSNQGCVFLDVSHGFNREQMDPANGFSRKKKGEKRTVLNDEQVSRLFASLSREVKVLLPGSNCLHHALVAQGLSGVLGAISTAIGGPWDIAGYHQVKQAGGSVCAFRFADNDRQLQLLREGQSGIETIDILISANSQSTLMTLSNHLLHCL